MQSSADGSEGHSAPGETNDKRDSQLSGEFGQGVRRSPIVTLLLK